MPQGRTCRCSVVSNYFTDGYASDRSLESSKAPIEAIGSYLDYLGGFSFIESVILKRATTSSPWVLGHVTSISHSTFCRSPVSQAR